MTREQGALLVAIARNAIARHLGLPHEPLAATREKAWLDEPKATFVTLHKQGALRGCIGSLEARRPLIVDVTENALAAAFNDPRFPPVTAEEWPLIDVEVSVLSEPRPLKAANEREALSALRPGRDGVILECPPYHRATFLPQVWEQLPDARTFLAHLKLKAGLPADAWSEDFRLYTYEVEKFRQTEMEP